MKLHLGHYVVVLLLIASQGLFVKRAAAHVEQTRVARASTISIRWVNNRVEVTGLNNSTLAQLQSPNWTLTDWQRLLRVHIESSQSSLPAMLGTYRVVGRAIRFEPGYPLQPGISYEAIFRSAELPGSGTKREELTAVLRVPSRSVKPTTTVTQIFPTAEVLPENLLKFYVHFSAPMSRGHIYDYIRLMGEYGKQVELPFLEIGEELWDDSMTRLTLFIDPGRIKRGVLPLEDVGPALEAGKRYSLVIDKTWRDGTGQPLKDSFQKQFRVGEPDRDPPDPAKWKVESPTSGTNTPLVVVFTESMDNALTQRVISVVDASGIAVAGQVTLSEHERRWTFQPAGKWKQGQHQLVIQTTIEDLAGNNIGKPFDVDLFEGVQKRLTSESVRVTFSIR